MAMTKETVESGEARLVSGAEESGGEVGEEEEGELWWSLDSEIGDALDWLDSKDDDEGVEGGFTLNSRRPNAHGGHHSRPNSSTLQPLNNRNQKFSNHIRASPLEELAIKVYKTSVLVFKDRDRYVQGDYRFRHGYCRHNPRKMVKTWAEKEMRNLLRLKAAGIRCPTPFLLRLHVLVMEFIGKAGWAAPRLRDAALSLDKLREGYMEVCSKF
ncbi:Serine/threonine protein kinase [Parasponia andersonii]|uniref:Serine/threonine-protein kinase RIO1 n=1 Tax=Parasponia andersonii TaxID=3476 RepID=A0A2P5DVI8_PARAD|nr:Serine/threonine protein kinase [Parasponia andersonii]